MRMAGIQNFYQSNAHWTVDTEVSEFPGISFYVGCSETNNENAD
jgi:hypothetical protein